MRGFTSDNSAGIHPAIFSAIAAANAGHVAAYGDDPYTERAIARFKEHFGADIDVYFVFNGTGGNVLGLGSVLRSYHAVICAETAHLNVDECGALENSAGCKILPVASSDGKLTVANIESRLFGRGDQHHVQAKAVSLSQTSELGTLYTPAELRAIADFAHARGMLVHVDGARIANAAAALKSSLREVTRDAGVDILTFGGTKNGLMCGEAVIFFNPWLHAASFPFVRKQGMQLASKMRFISAQFEALLSDDLWRTNAAHANRMAQLLERKVSPISGVRVTQPVQANAVFATVPASAIPRIQSEFSFYVWNADRCEV
ncbi:MAG: beta-eliminating lyase-related protein, partial [Candidatus Eremiobacteraeota bacterium]|nr:beta-eliminating lyase-related protein [Candidatus Eremiobacteraeota bacterium]